MKDAMTLETLLEKISSADPDERSEAWMSAGEVGTSAIKPLAAIVARTTPVVAALAKELAILERAERDEEARAKIAAKQDELSQPLEAGRAAKRALWKIVRHVGRPGASVEKQAALGELLDLLSAAAQPATISREVIAMLSETGDDQAVDAIADLLDDEELREHARVALERMPTKMALAALQTALETATGDFQISIAQSLRARGMEVPDLPSEKDMSSITEEP